jgi:GDP-L-fucose synthase
MAGRADERKMKILIFGGNGFLGNRLLPMLRERGHEVFAPRSSEIDLLREVPHSAPDWRQLDAIVHAAAIYGGMPFDMNNQGRILATNTRMNLNVFEFARHVQPGKLITIGSACSYPGYVDQVLREADLFGGRLHETVECHGFTKLWMVAAHRAYRDTFGLNGIHLIPANLYGPGDVYQLERAHVVAALIKKYTDAHVAGGDVTLMGDGTPIREFLYIDDLAELIIRSIERVDHQDQPINAGTGIGHSIRALAELIAEQVGFKGKTHWNTSDANGAMHKLMDIARMQQYLGPFEPVHLAGGIRKTIEWYLPRKAEADARL